MGQAWQKFYENAVHETDIREIQHRVAEARQAIQQRVEGPSSEVDATELKAIEHALAALMSLEIEMSPD